MGGGAAIATRRQERHIPEPSQETDVPAVTIYTKQFCPYCSAAKDLLRRKGVAFEEIDAAADPAARAAMMARSGGRATYPQIFIGDRHVGGCDDIHALDQRGELDPLLAA